MVDPDAFSALRIESIFPEHYPARQRRQMHLFDLEYWDGLWHQDRLPGVDLMFPEANPRKLGVVTLEHPFEEALPPRPLIAPDPAVERENAARVLDLLEMPFQFGDSQAKMKTLAGKRKVRSERNRAAKLAQITFQCDKQPVYRLSGIFHYKKGLLHLEVVRLDLARANARKSKAQGRKSAW